MPASPAQIDANRRNARLSTGPRTPEGKARSRANSYRHGRAGEGIVLPAEDLAEVDRLDRELQAELQPSGPLGRILVRRVATLSARMERCVRHDFATTAARARHAEAAFDDNRKADAELMLSWLASEPLTYSRRLRETPEGLDLMIREWERLAADLAHPSGPEWSAGQFGQAANLTGDRLEGHHVTRWRALSRVFWNDRHLLQPGEAEGLDAEQAKAWAAGQLAAMVAAELDEARARRAAIDEDSVALDRAGAADRSLFDPSKEAILARKYEAAAERGMYRALRELREAEAEAAARPSPGPGDPDPELASSGSDAGEPAGPPVEPPRAAVAGAPATSIRPLGTPFSSFPAPGRGLRPAGSGRD